MVQCTRVPEIRIFSIYFIHSEKSLIEKRLIEIRLLKECFWNGFTRFSNVPCIDLRLRFLTDILPNHLLKRQRRREKRPKRSIVHSKFYLAVCEAFLGSLNFWNKNLSFRKVITKQKIFSHSFVINIRRNDECIFEISKVYADCNTDFLRKYKFYTVYGMAEEMWTILHTKQIAFEDVPTTIAKAQYKAEQMTKPEPFSFVVVVFLLLVAITSINDMFVAFVSCSRIKKFFFPGFA